VVLKRRGYEQINEPLTVGTGKSVVYEPKWVKLWLPESTVTVDRPEPTGTLSAGTPGAGFAGWIQDFELAKQLAAQRSKSILVLFDGSDWCGYSMRMAEQVFFQQRFLDVAARQYVLVLVDFPRGEAGRANVENQQRNARLAAEFGVTGFPSIAVADSEGLPFGWAGFADDVDEFLRRLDELQVMRHKRDSLFADVRVSQGKEKAEAAMQALAFLAESDVLPFYVRTFGDWYGEAREADPRNEQGQLEAFFEILWFGQLSATLRTPPHDLRPVVQQLDAWKRDHQFKDRDRAARMHLRVALLMKDDPEAVNKYAAEGLAYQPRDEKLAQTLKFLQDAAGKLNIVNVGSGFAVAPGGYLLTNYHVVEEIRESGVRLSVHGVADQQPLPAEVVATAPERDLALVRVSNAAGAGLMPLPISSKPLARGESVAAFGYPLGEAVGKGVKLTTGYVSATHEQTDNGMVLLDCRVNPGNSGGPICGKSGQVVGIVTAKSFASGEVDSYGMAVPGDQLIAFLREHLTDFAEPSEPQETAGPADWAAVDRQVSPSVLMLMLKREPR
jgi:S1-C subfamily serine protease